MPGNVVFTLRRASWWRNQMETFPALLALCAGNSPVTGEFPSQKPVTRSFDVFFDLCLNKRLSKQSWRWWFETPSRSLWRHRNVIDFPFSTEASDSEEAGSPVPGIIFLLVLVCIVVACIVRSCRKKLNKLCCQPKVDQTPQTASALSGDISTISQGYNYQNHVIMANGRPVLAHMYTWAVSSGSRGDMGYENPPKNGTVGDGTSETGAQSDTVVAGISEGCHPQMYLSNSTPAVEVERAQVHLQEWADPFPADRPSGICEPIWSQ